jgi:hypothetical protein
MSARPGLKTGAAGVLSKTTRLMTFFPDTLIVLQLASNAVASSSLNCVSSRQSERRWRQGIGSKT